MTMLNCYMQEAPEFDFVISAVIYTAGLHDWLHARLIDCMGWFGLVEHFNVTLGVCCCVNVYITCFCYFKCFYLLTTCKPLLPTQKIVADRRLPHWARSVGKNVE